MWYVLQPSGRNPQTIGTSEASMKPHINQCQAQILKEQFLLPWRCQWTRDATEKSHGWSQKHWLLPTLEINAKQTRNGLFLAAFFPGWTRIQQKIAYQFAIITQVALPDRLWISIQKSPRKMLLHWSRCERSGVDASQSNFAQTSTLHIHKKVSQILPLTAPWFHDEKSFPLQNARICSSNLRSLQESYNASTSFCSCCRTAFTESFGSRDTAAVRITSPLSP